jgi:alkylhydroperoxidase/carboxymuconolactone decarboxylase family protein YurZ
MQHPIRLRSSGTTEGDTARVLGKLERSGKDIPIIRVVANWPEGFRPFVLMADALLTKGVLSPKMREFVVLHIAARQNLDYEWDEHAVISATAGVTDQQRTALRGGGVPPLGADFTVEDVAAIAFADQLLRGEPLSPDDWDAACAAIGEDAAREVVFAVAWWGGYVPVIARSLVALALGDHGQDAADVGLGPGGLVSLDGKLDLGLGGRGPPLVAALEPQLDPHPPLRRIDTGHRAMAGDRHARLVERHHSHVPQPPQPGARAGPLEGSSLEHGHHEHHVAVGIARAGCPRHLSVVVGRRKVPVGRRDHDQPLHRQADRRLRQRLPHLD